MNTTYDRQKLMASSTPIHAIDGMTCRFSDSPPIRNVALDVAAGVTYSLNWMVDDERTAWLGIATTNNNRATIAFTSPNHDAFVRALVTDRFFFIAVEGCIPATVHLGEAATPLDHYATWRGWF